MRGITGIRSIVGNVGNNGNTEHRGDTENKRNTGKRVGGSFGGTRRIEDIKGTGGESEKDAKNTGRITEGLGSISSPRPPRPAGLLAELAGGCWPSLAVATA